MRQRRIIALMLALFMLLAPLNDTVRTFAALAEATDGSLATSTPEVSAPTQTTSAPDATVAPVQTTSAPDATDAPETAGSPEASAAPQETEEPASTGTPAATDEPASTGTPEATEEPGSTGTPEATSAPEEMDSILMAVPRGFVFRAALSEDDSLKKTLGVTVEWVDDGVSHVNNLKLEMYDEAQDEWVTVTDAVSVVPDPNESFTGQRKYTYTVSAGVRYRLTAPAEPGYDLVVLDATVDPTLTAAFRYVSKASMTASVTWIGDPAGTSHGNDAHVAVYDRDGRLVTDAKANISSNGNVQNISFTGLDPAKLASGEYVIRHVLPEGYEDISSDADAAEGKFTLLNTKDTVTVRASVEWWDGHANSRPSISPRVQVKQDGQWVDIEAPLAKEISLTNDKVEYAFYGLPAGSEYRVDFGEAPDGYLQKLDSDSADLVLVKEAEFSFEKQWRDYSLDAGKFIEKADWVDLLTLCSNEAEDGTGIELTYGGNVQVVGDTLQGIDDWAVTITGLPAYSGVDTEIDYYVKEENRDYSGPDGDHYELTINNYGNNALKRDGVYNGGLSISTLTGTTSFSFTKTWSDDSADPADRPDVTFYLYRFPINNGSFQESSPVQGMDNMQMPQALKALDSCEILYTNAEGRSSLPKYDENGALYVYFVLETMSPADNYVSVVGNGGADFWGVLEEAAVHGDIESPDGFRRAYAGELTRYVLNGGAIENRKQETIRLDYSKEWVSKSTQGFQATITVTLQRAVAGTDEWENVTDSEGRPVTQTITGFKAELMTRYSSFTGLPQFDAQGRELVYRVRETGVTINGEAAEMDASGLYFTAGDYEFTIDHNDTTNRITNTLVGETEFQIKKQWQPALEDGASGSIVVQMYQDGVAYTPDASMLPEGATINPNGTLTLTGAGDVAAWLLRGLPKYNDRGAQYTYTVEEIGCDPASYSLTDQWYTSEELPIELNNGVQVLHDVTTCVFVNTEIGDGESLTFMVQKIWLDDDDQLHRGDVNVQLYYMTRDENGNVTGYEAVADASVTLEPSNQWIKMLHYIPPVPYDPTSPEWNVDNYFMREVSIADSAVEGSLAMAEYEGRELKGVCVTTEHIYAVDNHYQVRSPLHADVTVSNLRMGTVNIEIVKTWNFGGTTELEGEELTARFTVYQNGEEYQTVLMPISTQNNTLTIEGLPKYDAQGVLYSYTIEESGLNDETFVDGIIDWGDFYVTSTGSADEYEVGEHHSNDWMRANFTNTRVSSDEIVVNKVWRDNGTDAIFEKRPDIVLTLYRQSVDADGQPLRDENGAVIEPELVMVDRLWDTRINRWHWHCSFGDLPLFDEQGYEYLYTVQERIIQASPERYHVSYYVPDAANPQLPSDVANPASSRDVFEPMGTESGYTIAAPMGHQGTVINTLVGTMSFNGRKVWSSLPAWFQYKDLPPVTILLYRSEIVDGVEGEAAPYLDANGEQVSVILENGETSYRFMGLPRYDAYGCDVYRYYAREVMLVDGAYVESAPEGYEVVYDNNLESGIITNCYTGTPFIRISALKEWDWSNLEEDSDTYTYPAVTLTLYQCYNDPEKGYDVRRAVGVVNLPGGTIPASKELTTQEEFFTNTDDGTEYFPLSVPYWGEDEAYQYTYEVEETLTETGEAIKGYRVSVSCTTSEISDPNAQVQWHFSATNTYEPMKDQLTATKIWRDQNNIYGTRPTIDERALTFRFFRKAYGSADPAEELRGTTAWRQDTSDSNRWICVFTPADDVYLYEYDTNGNPYTYYVVEDLAAPYDLVYTSTDINLHDLHVTNALNTVSLSVKKAWELNGVSMTDRSDLVNYLQPLMELLGIDPADQRLTFRLKGLDAATQAVIDAGVRNGTIADTISLSVLASSLYTTDGYVLFTGLPMYVRSADGFTLAQYDVDETLIGDQIVGRNCDFTTTESHEGNCFSFKNAINTVSLSLRKIWEDARNQDGLRPYEIQVTIQASENGSVNETVVTLSYDPDKPDAAWTRTLYLPVSIGGSTPTYTITEVAVNGYSVAYSLDGAAATTGSAVLTPGADHSVSMTNTHVPLRFDADVLKSWYSDAGYEALVRPDSVHVKLQYKNGATWTDCNGLGDLGANFAEKTLLASDSWSGSWENLYVYKPKAASDPVYSSSVLTYRVIETDEGTDWPYTPSYQPGSFTGLSGGVHVDEVDVTVSNTMKTVRVQASKTWINDSGFSSITRPSSITLQLQYSTDEITWTNMGNPVTLNKNANKNTQYAYWSGLPKYDKNNQRIYYRVVETDTHSGYTCVHGTTTFKAYYFETPISNTLKTLQISVSKDWQSDFDDGYSTRPDSLSFTLQYTATPGVEASWTTLNKGSSAYTIQLNAANGWSSTFTGLPAYDGADNLLYYRVVEQSLGNYAQAQPSGNQFHYVEDGANQYSITFENTLILTDFTMRKAWDDQNDKYGLRPSSVTVTLERTTTPNNAASWERVLFRSSGSTTATVVTATVPDGSGSWAHTFADLPMYDRSGVQYVYRVVDSVHGYTYTGEMNADGTTYVLTNHLKEFDFTATKQWDDQNDLYDTRPATLTVTLQRSVNASAANPVWENVVVNGSAIRVTLPYGEDGSWSYTFEKLPVEDAQGRTYTYRIAEDDIPGYRIDQVGSGWTSNGASYTLNNDLIVTDFTGRKVWNDQDNRYGTRPVSLTVTLQRSINASSDAAVWTDVVVNGSAITAVLNAANGWSHTFEDLPAMDTSGNAYSYRIRETVPTGYRLSSAAYDQSGAYVLTNDLIVTSLSVRKAWQDQNDKYGIRPDDLTLTLQRRTKVDGVYTSWTDVQLSSGQLAQWTLTSANDWSMTLDGLPAKDANGNEYDYRVRENVPGGYKLISAVFDADDVYVLTNQLTTTSIEVDKTWSYEDSWVDTYGFAQPASIQFELRYKAFAEGETVDTQYAGWAVVPGAGALTLTSDASGSWKRTIIDLPMYDADGKLYVYVALDALTGYDLTATHGSTSASIRNTAQTTRLVVTKQWDDQNDRLDLRPEDVELTLTYSLDGATWTPVSGVRPVREGWTFTYSNLPAYTWVNGAAVAYQYRVEEGDMQYYQLTENRVSGTNDSTGYSQTLKNSLDALDVTVTKAWQADDDAYLEETEDSVRVQLQRKLATEGDEAWTDCAPVALVNGAAQSGQVILSTEGGWSATWQGLPKRDESGAAYVYRVKEVSAPIHYPLAAPVEVSANGEATITNTLETVRLSVTKQWLDGGDALGWRPDQFSITLQSRIAGEAWADFDTVTFVPDQTDGMTMTITGLPKNRWKDGIATEIEYRAIDSVTGYVYVWNPETSTLTNQAKSYTLVVTKEWEDQSDAYGTQDLSVTLQLRQRRVGGEWVNYGSAQTISAGSTPAWTATFADIPAVYQDALGQDQPYEYSLVETGSLAYVQSIRVGNGAAVPLEDYVFTCRSDGDAAHYATACALTLTNTLEVTDFPVRKVWEDRNDIYEARPESLTVTLQCLNADTQSWQDVLKDGSAVTAVLSGDNAWSYTFTDLPARDAKGRNCTYRVAEERVPRYTLISAGLDGKGVYTLTNHLSLLHLNVSKTWEDEDDQYNNRPEALTVTLQSSADGGLSWSTVEHNGAAVTAQLTAPDWSYTFDNLPDQDATGAALIYRAVETVPTGYTASEPVVNEPNCSLVNTLQTVTISGEKQWDDADNAYNTRPESIDLVVHLNGEPMDPQPDVVFDGWSFSISGLPLYVDGELAQYSVEELPVTYYTPEASIVEATEDDQGGLTLTLNNMLRGKLEIDNVTINAAHTDVTNVGGFVGVGETAEQRDIDPYVLGATTVTWRNEDDWLHQSWLSIRYCEYGSEEWTTLYLSDCFDLTVLMERFPDARIQVEGDTRRLILADDPADMPMLTHVDVAFQPTIAVENTTSGDRGGQVCVETGAYSTVGDGLDTRYAQTTVYGLANNQWMVDLKHLAVGVPGTQHGAYPDNLAAVPLNLQRNGSFSAEVTLELAGQMETVTINGQVKVLKRDKYGNPKQISLTVYDLPANLDLGIPFTTAHIPSDIPQTGDMLPVALTVGGVCLAGLILLAVLRRRRSR